MTLKMKLTKFFLFSFLGLAVAGLPFTACLFSLFYLFAVSEAIIFWVAIALISFSIFTMLGTVICFTTI